MSAAYLAHEAAVEGLLVFFVIAVAIDGGTAPAVDDNRIIAQSDEAGSIPLLASVDGAHDAQVADGGPVNVAEGSHMIAAVAHQTEVDDVASAIEGALEGGVHVEAHHAADGDVAVQAIILVGIFCIVGFYHDGHVVPVVAALDEIGVRLGA